MTADTWDKEAPLRIEALATVPKGSWIQIHLRGGHHVEGFLYDTSENRVIVDSGDARNYIRPSAIDLIGVIRKPGDGTSY